MKSLVTNRKPLVNLVATAGLMLGSAAAQAYDWQTPLMWDWAMNTANPTLEQHDSEIESLRAEVEAMQSENAEMRAYISKLQEYVEIDDMTDPMRPVVRVSAANLQVVNGQGDTETINGVGNLIVGYDEPRTNSSYICTNGDFDNELDCISAGGTWGTNHKSGSHNVVVGSLHAYSQYGGIAGGLSNVINQAYASVTGGYSNTASGYASSVTGGLLNTASGLWASVDGGSQSSATEFASSVSGGINNLASGRYASVSGGRENHAEGERSSVSGGQINTAAGLASSVSGGYSNRAQGRDSSISGGQDVRAYGDQSWAAGRLLEECC